jgi:hypothetical protein
MKFHHPEFHEISWNFMTVLTGFLQIVMTIILSLQYAEGGNSRQEKKENSLEVLYDWRCQTNIQLVFSQIWFFWLLKSVTGLVKLEQVLPQLKKDQICMVTWWKKKEMLFCLNSQRLDQIRHFVPPSNCTKILKYKFGLKKLTKLCVCFFLLLSLFVFTEPAKVKKKVIWYFVWVRPA